MAGLIVALLAVVAVAILLKLKSYFEWRSRIDKVGGPPATILAGTTKVAGKTSGTSRLKQVREFVKQYPKAYRLWQGPFLPMIYLCHPDTVKHVLDAKGTFKSYLVSKMFTPHLGRSIFTLNGAPWKHSRRMLTPAFHFKVLGKYLEESIDIVDDYVADLRTLSSSGPVDMEESAVELLLKILLQSVFSYRKEKNMTDWCTEFITATKNCDVWVAKRLDSPLHLIMPNWAYFMTANGKGYKQDCDTMRVLCVKVINDRLAEYQHDAVNHLQKKAERGEHLDFLDILLSSSTMEGAALSMDDIIAQVGFCLAKHPEFQQQCYEEAVAVLRDGAYTLNSIKQMKMLTMCLKEATRLYPPAGGIARDLEEPTVINGVEVDKGTTVIASIYGIHHNPEVWPDPEKFDPHRFNPDKEGASMDPYAWLIFAAGARNCIGQKYAEMQAKMILTKLLAAFEFSVVPGREDCLPVPSVILKSHNGIHLVVTPRADIH